MPSSFLIVPSPSSQSWWTTLTYDAKLSSSSLSVLVSDRGFDRKIYAICKYFPKPFFAWYFSFEYIISSTRATSSAPTTTIEIVTTTANTAFWRQSGKWQGLIGKFIQFAHIFQNHFSHDIFHLNISSPVQELQHQLQQQIEIATKMANTTATAP